ncbi:MAG: isochorismatase family protein [Betaproteobacteria bacterium]|nr:isochorismatase family protein [Betaproteobacteria bacterium]
MSATAKRPWDGVVSEADLEVYRKAGFGRTGGLGKRPVLLVIDVQYRTVGNAPKPILESLQDYPTSCGEYGWRAVSQIEKLVQVFRRHKLPIIYPSIAPKTPRDMGRFANKMPSAPQDNPKAFEIVESIAPAPDDIILYKHFSSAFFGTALATHLVRLGADSLVLTGCTTSGCVRATAVDACSLDYRIVVPEDAVYDRGQVSHAVNLFDIANKYADVVPTAEAVQMVEKAVQPA